jgi:C-terminal processing protease CtpA/Prc
LTFNSPDEFILIGEFGGMITVANDTVKVEMVAPPDQRPEAYKSLDIQVGDVIKIVNGKSLTSIKPLEEIYEKASPGDLIKLGIIRNQKPTLIKFTKANPDDMPGKMEMKIIGGPDGSALTPLLDAGLVLTVEDDQIKIADVIEEIHFEFSGYTPHEGDVITELNGQKLQSMEMLNEIYETIKPGETVNLTLLHDGKKQQTLFTKQADPGMRKIIRKTN